jgi:hypothetical protein
LVTLVAGPVFCGRFSPERRDNALGSPKTRLAQDVVVRGDVGVLVVEDGCGRPRSVGGGRLAERGLRGLFWDNAE